MESRQPQKSPRTEGLRDGQPSRSRRFRIIKLEERIAPKKGGMANTKKCATLGCDPYADTVFCW